jgi:hypothetical protein
MIGAPMTPDTSEAVEFNRERLPEAPNPSAEILTHS